MTTPPNLPARPRLACDSCSKTYNVQCWCCACGKPLDFATDPTPSAATPDDADLDYRDSLWTFDDFLPTEPHASLDEGITPLVDAAEWETLSKLEYVLPPGSFKDRGTTTVFLLVSGLGVERVVRDSSGSAGTAVATHTAHASTGAEIYVLASAKPSKVHAIECVGVRPVRIRSSRQAVTDACVEVVGTDDAWYASHAQNPTFSVGTATVAYEIAVQCDWSVPDAVVTLLGHGMLFLGAYHGLRALYEMDWVDRMPELYGAQATGYSSIVDVRHRTADETNDVADDIQILDPIHEAEIHEALDAIGGDAIALSVNAVEDELDRPHRHGLYTEPTCTVTPAALRELRLSGVLNRDADTVVPLTGSGLKS